MIIENFVLVVKLVSGIIFGFVLNRMRCGFGLICWINMLVDGLKCGKWSVEVVCWMFCRGVFG